MRRDLHAIHDNGGVKLLVAAHASELVAFEDDIPGFARLLTGVGKIPAAYALTRALCEGDYDEIVVVGTAGAIDDDIEGGIYDIAGAIQHDVKGLDGTFGEHVSLPTRVETGREGLAIATGDHFVDDAEAVRLIRELGAGLVDMESYALIWVAQQFDVPIRILRAVSDRAQDGATELWDVVVERCSHELRARVRALYGV
ncbi:adenosylhomocysteine nucleosidase [Microbacterium trichothecenolyticum]|uniref:Adenosylhomocysteine nucleosidase n=1 Tax=Microbacterium trichothecenolyticum TaxID=69370 RepID=A0ABU0TY07_MICTR|nr:adenosylhomocysteine nucleosidase [Microbacterium trichothecenolyticum]